MTTSKENLLRDFREKFANAGGDYDGPLGVIEDYWISKMAEREEEIREKIEQLPEYWLDHSSHLVNTGYSYLRKSAVLSLLTPAEEKVITPCCQKCIIPLDYKPSQCNDGECECHKKSHVQ